MTVMTLMGDDGDDGDDGDSGDGSDAYARSATWLVGPTSVGQRLGEPQRPQKGGAHFSQAKAEPRRKLLADWSASPLAREEPPRPSAIHIPEVSYWLTDQRLVG